MHVFKNVAILLAATLSTIFLIPWSIQSFGFGSFIFAFLINWLVVCWIASLSFVVDLPFPSAYHAIKIFEASGRINERIGIRAFRKFVRRGPLRVLSPKLRLPKKITAAAVRELEGGMRKAESVHVLGFVVTLLVRAYAAVRVGIGSVWSLVFNIAINVYPNLLQRYNRPSRILWWRTCEHARSLSQREGGLQRLQGKKQGHGEKPCPFHLAGERGAL